MALNTRYHKQYVANNRHMCEYDGAVARSTYLGYPKVAKHKHECKQMLLCSLYVVRWITDEWSKISLTFIFFFLLTLVIQYLVEVEVLSGFNFAVNSVSIARSKSVVMRQCIRSVFHLIPIDALWFQALTKPFFQIFFSCSISSWNSFKRQIPFIFVGDVRILTQTIIRKKKIEYFHQGELISHDRCKSQIVLLFIM